MDKLDNAVAGKDKKVPIEWTQEMKECFEILKSQVKENVHKLALPASNEQLTLLPDATVKTLGIGFLLLVNCSSMFLPVHFMSCKLKKYHME